MNLSATIKSSLHHHEVAVQTNGDSQSITISSKSGGYGSSVNGGEFLLLALATCFCNDIYREAAKRKIQINAVEVECTGVFGAEGEPGSDFHYKAKVTSTASQDEIEELINHTDRVAEIHATLRKGVSVTLVK